MTGARCDAPTFNSADEFAQWYANNGNTTVERLRYYGRYPERCDCGDPICTGWQMGRQQDEAQFDDAHRL